MTTQEMNTDDALRAILENLEAEQNEKNKLISVSYVNQPEKISISSNDAEAPAEVFNPQLGNSFYNFTINLPRPALSVKSLELLSANIPQAQVNIPDDSLIFFYYKIRMIRNFDDTASVFLNSPSINNLYYVRLLPSYYKQELIPNYNNYGFNRTFNNYQDLADELSKSCTTDVAYVNTNSGVPQFIPNDISIVYNEDLNKFQMIAKKANILDYSFPIWAAGITYDQNDIVYLNDTQTFYISNVNNNLGNIPSISTEWNVYCISSETSSKNWYTYLVAGYKDPNVWELSQTLRTTFEGSDFNLGDKLQLFSIPPNPIKQYQTLNLRLGFTWNGLFNWNDSLVVPVYTGADLNQNIIFALFNRLRPVPQYQFEPVDQLLSALPPYPTPYTSLTYTAENFANLVYSSVVSIYTSIIGASTTDTQRNTNLLSIVPMDCNNLGITFYEPKISAKLTKIIRDIYSIYFEFRREDGSPYYFSNNAIITLQLGLTY